MINTKKWLETINRKENKLDSEIKQIDSKKWTDTIPEKNTYNSITKYSFLAVAFITSLLLISVVKNETRKLEKEINILTASTKKLKFNLSQAILDYEVLASPENISLLADEYLENSFVVYKRSQIIRLTEKETAILNSEKAKLPNDIKSKLRKKFNSTKVEIQKIKELYSNPKTIPSDIKSKIAKKIENKKVTLNNLYKNPRETITPEKIQRWASIQLVKIFLGFPTIGK